jgi:molybdopterin molybdotransferase
MDSYREALEKIRQVASQHLIVEKEIKELENSVGRTLAEDIFSEEAVPAFNNSAMDGYAVMADKTRGASLVHPVEFLVAGEIAAGDWLADEKLDQAGTQSCFEIMTGAPMPARIYDAVVKVEDVLVGQNDSGQSIIRIQQPLSSGENVRPAGTDIAQEQELFAKGKRITAEMLLAAAACGKSRLPVLRRPRVALLSTGSELLDFTQTRLQAGKIRNCTGIFLVQKLRDLGCEVTNFGLIRDDPHSFSCMFSQMLASGPDLIITTGAVSMGKYDFILPALKDFGATIHFHKVAIRPGKPIVFAEIPSQIEIPKVPFFGMPGNPVSTAVALRFFVTPFLRGLCGLEPEVAKQAKAKFSSKKPAGLQCFYKANIEMKNGEATVEVVSQQASYMVGNFSDINSWVVLPEDGHQVESGQILDCFGMEVRNGD